MNSLSLGPLVLSGERFAIIAGVIVFMIGSSILVSRISGRFNLWSTVVAIGGVAVARLAHVIAHWEYFSGDPMRAFAVWQDGFAWLWVLPFVALATFLLLKTRQERAWAIAPVAAAALVWVVRRRNIWRRFGVALTESGPRQGLAFRRRACGAASGDVRWSVS